MKYPLNTSVLTACLLLCGQSYAQCGNSQWGDVGGGATSAQGYTGGFSVAAMGSRIESIRVPSTGGASLYASYDIGKEIRQVRAIGGSTAWANDGTTLWALNGLNLASNPIRFQSTFAPPGGVRDFIPVGFTIYSWQGNTVSVIDYTNAAAPSLISTITLPNTPFQASFFNNRVYFLSSGRTVQIVDVTDPANPAFIRSLSLGGSTFTTLSSPYVFSGGGSLVHFAFYSAGVFVGSNVLRVVDINADQLSGASGSVALSGNIVQINGNYLLQSQGLLSINWANPLAPVLTPIYSDSTSRFRGFGLVTSSGVTRAQIAGSEGGFSVFNTSTSALDGRYRPQPGAAYESAMFPSAGTLYIADGLDGLRAAAISDGGPASRSISLIGGTATGGALLHVAAGDAFIVATDGVSVPCYSSASPNSPLLIGTYSPVGTTEDLAASGDAAFVIRNAGGVRQLDMVRVPGGSPALQDTVPVPVDSPSTFRRVRAVGGVVVTVDSQHCRLFSFSAPTPANLQARAVITIGADLRDAAVSGDTLYLLDFDGHLHVCSIANLDAPTIVRTVDCAASHAGMAVNGDWMATVGDSIEFVNVSDGSNPVAVASSTLPNVCSDVAAAAGPSGPHFLVSAGACGVRAFAAPIDWAPVIIGQPLDTSACLGGTASFTTTVLAPNSVANPTSYQWNRVGAGGGPISGGNGPTLIITGVTPDDTAFTYECVATNSCGSATSTAAALTVCRVDVNCSGTVSVQDIFDFLASFFAEDSAADFNGQSGITVQDLFDFLAAFFAGCS